MVDESLKNAAAAAAKEFLEKQLHSNRNYTHTTGMRG
jgi:hypothetical protein